MCKSSRDRAGGGFCAGGASSYTLKPHQSEEHACEVCGIHHMFAQHGALGKAWYSTGAKAAAWCLLIHADAPVSSTSFGHVYHIHEVLYGHSHK
jgi:hypothetical protein